VAKLLRSRCKAPLATIFLQRRVEPDCIDEFVDKVLASIHKQLRKVPLNPANSRGKKWSRIPARLEGGKDRVVLEHEHRVRDSISSILQTTPCAYLVIDDLDCCGPLVARHLQDELLFYQSQGLRILTTSRISSRSSPPTGYWCDHCAPDGPYGENPRMWDVDVLVCKACFDEADDAEKDEACAVCGDCRGLGRGCNKGRYVDLIFLWLKKYLVD
jgi:hypothetical protein